MLLVFPLATGLNRCAGPRHFTSGESLSENSDR